MFRNYIDVSYESTREGSTPKKLAEKVISSYRTSDWLRLLLDSYPLEGLAPEIRRQFDVLQDRWRGLHSIHNPELQSTRSVVFNFLEKWAQERNNPKLWPTIHANGSVNQQLNKEYNSIIREIAERYSGWLTAMHHIPVEQQSDQCDFVLRYCLSFNKNPRYVAGIVWSYYWLKHHAPYQFDPRWHQFFSELETARQGNEEVAYIGDHSEWGERSWSCPRGVVERLRDLICVLNQEEKLTDELQQWWEETRCENDKSPQPLSVTQWVGQRQPLCTYWQKREQYPNLTPLLNWAEEQSLASDGFFQPLLAQTCDEALQDNLQPSFFLQRWEAALRDRMCTYSHQSKTKEISLSTLSQCYLDKSIGALISARGTPTQLLQSLFIASVQRYVAQHNQQVCWKELPMRHYVPRSEDARASLQQDYLEERQRYFYKLSAQKDFLDIEKLSESLKNKSALDIQQLWEMGASCGFWTDKIPSQSAVLTRFQRLQIISYLTRMVPEGTQIITAQLWDDLIRHRCETDLLELSSHYYPAQADIDSLKLPAGFSREHFKCLPATPNKDTGQWIFLTPHGNPVGKDMEDLFQTAIKKMRWSSLCILMSDISGLRKELFIDLEAMCQTQKWPMKELLFEFWELAQKPPYEGETLKKVCRESQIELGIIAYQWYKNHPDPWGLSYAIVPELAELCLSQWLLDINNNSQTQRWAQSFYVDLLSTMGLPEIDLPSLNNMATFLMNKNMPEALRAFIIACQAKSLENPLRLDVQKRLIKLWEYDGRGQELLYHSGLIETGLKPQLIIAILNSDLKNGDKFIAQQYRSAPLDGHVWLSLLSQCSYQQSSALIHIFEHLSTYDRKKVFSPHNVPLLNRLSLGTIIRHIKGESFNTPETKRELLAVYFQHICPLEQLFKGQRTIWLKEVHEEVAAGYIPLSYYKQLLEKYITPHKKEWFDKEAFDDAIPLRHKNYSMLATMSSYGLLMMLDKGDRQGIFFKRLLDAGPPTHPLTEKEGDFFRKMGHIASNKNPSEALVADFLKRMLHPYYKPALYHWLCYFSIAPQKVWEKIGLIPELDKSLRYYVMKCCKMLLRGYKETICHEMDNFMLNHLATAQQAEAFYQRIQCEQWGVFISPITKMSIPEQHLKMPASASREGAVFAWMMAGYPIERPGESPLDKLALVNGYKTLQTKMIEWRQQWENNQKQWEEQKGSAEIVAHSDFYFGKITFKQPDLLFSMTNQQVPRTILKKK